MRRGRPPRARPHPAPPAEAAGQALTAAQYVVFAERTRRRWRRRRGRATHGLGCRGPLDVIAETMQSWKAGPPTDSAAGARLRRRRAPRSATGRATHGLGCLGPPPAALARCGRQAGAGAAAGQRARHGTMGGGPAAGAGGGEGAREPGGWAGGSAQAPRRAICQPGKALNTTRAAPRRWQSPSWCSDR